MTVNRIETKKKTTQASDKPHTAILLFDNCIKYKLWIMVLLSLKPVIPLNLTIYCHFIHVHTYQPNNPFYLFIIHVDHKLSLLTETIDVSLQSLMSCKCL